jgi:hypothetical protein
MVATTYIKICFCVFKTLKDPLLSYTTRACIGTETLYRKAAIIYPMVDYLYVDLDSGNVKAAPKGSLGGTPGRWHPVVWVDTLTDVSDPIMSTIEGIRSWMHSSKAAPVPASAIIATSTDLTILDSDAVLTKWKQLLSNQVDPSPFPYVHTIDMGPQVLGISYDLTKSHPIQPEDIWVKIEHNPATPGTIQLPGGISCEPSDADPSDKEAKPATPATPGPPGRPGGHGGGPPIPGGGGDEPGPGGGGAPSAPAPFPGPAGAGEGEGQDGDESSDSQESGGAWGVWYGGDE